MAEKKLKPGWRVWRFEQMAQMINDRVDNPAEAGSDYYVGLEHLDSDSLKIRRWGKPTDVEATKLRFRKGDIIFGRRRAYQRKLAVAEFDGICSAHAMVLRARPDVVLPEFLPFFMQSDHFMKRAVEISVGSLSPTINWRTLAVQEFALPSIKGQARLLEILLAVEEARESLGRLSVAADQTVKALLADEFSRPAGSPINLSDVGKWHCGNTPSRANPAYWQGNIPWISPKDMKVRLLSDAEEHISKQALDDGASEVPAGAILIVVRGMILAHTFPVARTTRPASLNQDMRALAVGPGFIPEYVHLWFEWAAPRYLQLVSASTHGTKRLESERLFSLSVPKPPVDHQMQFATRVNECLASARAAETRNQLLRTLKGSSLQGLSQYGEAVS